MIATISSIDDRISNTKWYFVYVFRMKASEKLHAITRRILSESKVVGSLNEPRLRLDPETRALLRIATGLDPGSIVSMQTLAVSAIDMVFSLSIA